MVLITSRATDHSTHFEVPKGATNAKWFAPGASTSVSTPKIREKFWELSNSKRNLYSKHTRRIE